MDRGTAVLGLGAYIPEEVRTNDWWPEALVEQWKRSKNKPVMNLEENRERSPDSLHPALGEELDKVKGDIFGGMRERRVAPADMLPSEMEVHACREALEDARVRPEEIELVMSFSLPNDAIVEPNVFKLHHLLGLVNARAMGVSVICHSFASMMDIAHQYIRNGSVRRALIVTSTKYSDIQDYSSTVSIAAGDGAVAAVLGDCPADHGILFSKHGSLTQFHDSMEIMRRPPARPAPQRYAWGERQSAERMYFTIKRPELARGAVSAVPVWGEKLAAEIYAEAGFAPQDMALMITNAAFPWYSPVLSKVFDIPMERVEDHVLEFSNMGAVNLPMNLYLAVKNGRVQNGDHLLLTGHGGGLSYGAIVLRWWRPNGQTS